MQTPRRIDDINLKTVTNDEDQMMNNATSKLASLALTAMLVAVGGAASAQNVNTTIQEGRINTNDTYQVGSLNDNATYQQGMDNANRTRQRGEQNWNQTGQFGRINYNETHQRGFSNRSSLTRGGPRD